MSSLAECTVSEDTQLKSRKIRIYPTKEQKILFKQWFGVSRKFYNTTVAYYNSKTNKDTINWMELTNKFTSELNYDYIKSVPYQIKKIAVRDCYRAYIANCKKTKKIGIPFKLKYRTRKETIQSCYIPKSALNNKGIYYTISGNLKMSERSFLTNKYYDLRLVKEYDRWYIVIPMEINNTKLPVSENQRNGDVVSLDPGVRSFMTLFSENGFIGKLGEASFNKIMNLNHKIDKLISKREIETDKNKKRNLYRIIGKKRNKLRDLVDELHWKTINFLVRNFSVIILPTFEVQNMVNKKNRRIKKSVVRAMLSLRFYEFGERLKNKCKEYGVVLIRSNEAYTSKTNSFTGEIMEIGSKKNFKYNGIKIDRDINGARNILLRAMRDSSASVEMQMVE